MARHFDDVMQDVASFLPPELFAELNDVIVEEIESCMGCGSSEMLNFTLDSN